MQLYLHLLLFTGHWLYARHCIWCFTSIVCLNIHINFKTEIMQSCYTDQGSKKRDLGKVITFKQSHISGEGRGTQAQAYMTLDSAFSHCFCSVTPLCLTLGNPMDCIPPGSSVHEIFQARILEWVATSSSRRPPWPRDQTQTSCIANTIIVYDHEDLRREALLSPYHKWENQSSDSLDNLSKVIQPVTSGSRNLSIVLSPQSHCAKMKFNRGRRSIIVKRNCHLLGSTGNYTAISWVILVPPGHLS